MRQPWVFGIACAGLCACGSASESQNASGAGGMAAAGASSSGNSGGSAGTASAGATGAGAGAAGAGATGAGGDQCPAAPALPPGGTNALTLPIQIIGAGAPITTGQAVTPAQGVPYKLSLLKFYLASPVLLGSDGTRVPAALVQANGMSRPYGVALVDLDDPASQ
ncbi:MAG: hypothetical protein ABJB12_19650, partial [Pseudomonadota bacterium]